jgi:hypothetical protein
MACPQCADSAYAADGVTAADRTDLMESSVNGTRVAATAERPHRRGQRNASDAGAKQSRFRRRWHRLSLLLADKASSRVLAARLEDERPRDPAVVALPEIDRAAVFEQAPVAGAPCGAPALPFGWGSVQSSRPALTCIIGARRAWIVPMISSTSIPCR